MEARLLFYVISGLWAMAIVFNLIAATRFSQQISARSDRAVGQGGPGELGNVVSYAFNRGVAPDVDTQELRWQMNKRLLIIVGGFVAYYIYLSLSGVFD